MSSVPLLKVHRYFAAQSWGAGLPASAGHDSLTVLSWPAELYRRWRNAGRRVGKESPYGIVADALPPSAGERLLPTAVRLAAVIRRITAMTPRSVPVPGWAAVIGLAILLGSVW
jgi:hypothetical protein